MGRTQMQLNITNRINVLRAEKRINQQQLAEGIEVTRMTISSIEKGKYNPSLELAFKLAIFFDVDLNEIFKVEKLINETTEQANE